MSSKEERGKFFLAPLDLDFLAVVHDFIWPVQSVKRKWILLRLKDKNNIPICAWFCIVL